MDTPGVALPVALAIALLVTQARRHRLWWALAGGSLLAGPVLAAWVARPNDRWEGWLAVASLSYVLAIGLFLLNNYAWGLYLEIDAARRGAADLAVAQERFRFAADLHDIQGHTLHVIRLKTQLARKLIDTNPEAARVHLLEAETLIGETLDNTRSLAFGDREVALAAELANAQALFGAAGIQCDVDGDPGAGGGRRAVWLGHARDHHQYPATLTGDSRSGDNRARTPSDREQRQPRSPPTAEWTRAAG